MKKDELLNQLNRYWYKFGEKPMQIINEDNTKIELSSNEQFADFFGE